jgi:hypothetical protein
MEAIMAIHDFDRGRQRNAFRDTPEEIDKSTLWAGAMLGAALLILIAYMLLFGPST